MRHREPYLPDWRALGLHGVRPLFEEAAAADPAVPLVFGSKQRPLVTTTGEMLARAEVVASAFHALGLTAGDVIVSQLPNWAEGMAAALAALKLGLVQVPVVDIYGAAELSYILRATAAKALVVPGAWRNIDFAERLAALDALPALRHVVVLGDAAMPRPVLRWEDLLASGSAPAPAHPADPGDVVLLNFTSGTTAAAKGAVHSHATLGGEARRIMPVPEPAEWGRLMFWLGPAGHIGSIVGFLRPFLIGEGAIYIDRYDATLALDLIRAHPVSRCAGAFRL